MEGDETSIKNKTAKNHDHGFIDMIFSWSIEDIFNEELYKNQVEKIDLSFRSVHHYLGNYIYPLLEETRAELCSRMEVMSNAPFAEVTRVEAAKPFGKKLYELRIGSWQNRFALGAKEPYRMFPGDVLVLTNYKPETVTDLQRSGRTWSFVSVLNTSEHESAAPVNFKVKASSDIGTEKLKNRSLFLVFLTNISSNRRIWNALHMNGNLKLVKQILSAGDMVLEGCNCCSVPETVRDDRSFQMLSAELNESQSKAVNACLSGLNCNHNSKVKLIWGPPGTGKTRTLATLLFALMRMKYRVLVCAPTNVAIKEVATRVFSILKESHGREYGDLFFSAGEMMLFGNNERLKVGEDIEDIYLDYRVQQLSECLAPPAGLSSCLQSMIDLLQRPVSHYSCDIIKNKSSFLQCLRESFLSTASKLRRCISILCTHINVRVMIEQTYSNLLRLNKELESFEELLFHNDLVSKGLEKLFSGAHMPEDSSWSLKDQLYKKRNECLCALINVKDSLGRYKFIRSFSIEAISEFCFQASSLIFCTTSGSYKLHSVAMKPLDILVMDEAAMCKECESLIPLQLSGISQAILVGDEFQLPAMVESNVSYDVGFGRSLFERLSLLGYPKHLLNLQHRMHPDISSFPNSYFYFNKICDAPNVQKLNYKKQYLPGPMFGPYSFINIIGGREEYDDNGRSRKNMAEISVIMTIVKNLHKVWVTTKEKLCIGIVSPYVAQISAIQEKLVERYGSHGGFIVNVKSIDGFQGGEQDIVILSTVRTNNRTALDFISSPQRANVALTRARHCLWVLGDERALANSDNVWKAVILDAKKRKCFFNADENEEFAKAILDAKKQVDQFDDLLHTDSILFRNAKWKVNVSDKFLRSFKRLRSKQSKKLVISLLERLSSGWRPKGAQVDLLCDNSFRMLKQFKVESRYVICSIDIVKLSRYTQILKLWDILPVEDIPKLAKRLESVFGRYTKDYISRCNEKGFDGDVESPLSWPLSTNIQKFKGVNNGKPNDGFNDSDDKRHAEKSNFEKSLMLMKYYSSSVSGQDDSEFDFPFDLTEEQRRVIFFPRSAFVLGRFGTGKTSVLTMKLIRNEKLHHSAVEAAYETKDSTIQEQEPLVLRQLFMTLNPELCEEVKHRVFRSKSLLSVKDIKETSTDIVNALDSFVDVPPNEYPIVITFRKFFLMLDMTLGNSYFERFTKIFANGNNLGPSLVSVESLVRTKEVNYERFDALYWPHFNRQLIKELDSHQVFFEIMTHIKGGIQAAEHGKLSREDYLTLSESRASSLSVRTRKMIYDIFEKYEKKKMKNCEFDLADVVIDLHRRLRAERYGGEKMHFIYIDEVQDLTVAQIALFKHICPNVEEGFVFCGDTANSIGRGIDFRFKDIRSLFYQKFVLESKCCNHVKRKENGPLCDMFVLSENFRTHAEVLKLSQSIIELLTHFFPYSVDVLKVDGSLISGEAPIVFYGCSIESFFVKSRCGKEIGGFGANQVILVRDNAAREEILHCVGKQALVLTILECKGREFEDVLLYNFFASSPLKRQWRVIYQFLKEKAYLDKREHYPSFDASRHNVLYSELKQLYVAVTRTRNRLWICEDDEDMSKPMIDYWTKKNLVQVMHSGNSYVKAMKDKKHSRGME